MSDAFLTVFRKTLPPEISDLIKEHLADLKNGNFFTLLSSHLTKQVVGAQSRDGLPEIDVNTEWNDAVFRRLNVLLNQQQHDLSMEKSRIYSQHFYFLVAVAALQLFTQITVTGPPVVFSTARLLFPKDVADDESRLKQQRSRLLSSLNVDGIAAYRLTPSPELLCLADTVLNAPAIKKNVRAAPWAALRISMMHQHLLSEPSSTLQDGIYHNLDQTWSLLHSLQLEPRDEVATQFHLEQAAVNLFHGSDQKARQDLDEARRQTGLQYALTGQLGKRTKYQDQATSQLVVLAKSEVQTGKADPPDQAFKQQPKTVNLEDEILLNSISFTKADEQTATTKAQDLPSALAALDPNAQPQLQTLDGIILLLLASVMTTAAPVDDLKREETLPYALRVLEGGSSNWQVYTQALLVRSRIEAFKSRTTERGLLQLQAVVDQIIAGTDSSQVPNEDGRRSSTEEAATSFIPSGRSPDSAPAHERLRYVHMLSMSTRWELEIELASRWTSVGGLRAALDIYERLEMWPEAALCYAATGREDKAKQLIRRQLYHPTDTTASPQLDETAETWEGAKRQPQPSDAPRLLCILGDLDNDPTMWEKAWHVSSGRYARAQRSLGRYHLSQRRPEKAAEAYARGLKVNQLNRQSWFAYGCCLLELSRFEEAVEAFARTVQLDDQDAEAWSNLAAALVKRGPKKTIAAASNGDEADSQKAIDINGDTGRKVDEQQHLRDALRSFKRAATLKQDSPRIYDNVLTVAASLEPPAYSDIVAAQRRIIELRGKVEGETCVDAEIVNALVQHVVRTYEPPTATQDYDNEPIPDASLALDIASRPGSIPALVIDLVIKRVQPLITRSAQLWRTLATLSVWRKRPSTALEANEKAWRLVIAQDEWERGDEKQWHEVAQATLDLVDAYESLGPQERTEGLAAGTGELVAKDWKFKGRSAIRGIQGRAKDMFEGTTEWEQLKARLTDLKGTT